MFEFAFTLSWSIGLSVIQLVIEKAAIQSRSHGIGEHAKSFEKPFLLAVLTCLGWSLTSILALSPQRWRPREHIRDEWENETLEPHQKPCSISAPTFWTPFLPAVVDVLSLVLHLSTLCLLPASLSATWQYLIDLVIFISHFSLFLFWTVN